MKSISPGSKVRHLTLRTLNGGVPMNVSKVADKKALCDHLVVNDQNESVFTQDWFDLKDLEVVVYGD